MQSSVAQSMDADDFYNMRDSALGGTQGGVLSYPYMCDQSPKGNAAEQELQFADKIKMMNNQKATPGLGAPGR
jgi:hypothetical protein